MSRLKPDSGAFRPCPCTRAAADPSAAAVLTYSISYGSQPNVTESVFSVSSVYQTKPQSTGTISTQSIHSDADSDLPYRRRLLPP